MSIKKMEYDNWINSLSNDTEIENPTWEQIEKAIKSLDADQHTMVILTSDTQSLIIGGGQGQYIITVLFGDDNHVSARRKSPIDGDIELNIGGQTGFYSKRLVLDFALTIHVVMIFWQKEILDPNLEWSFP